MPLFGSVNRTDFAWIRLFRSTPGDVGIADVPWVPSEGTSVDDVAMERLRSFHEDTTRRARLKPIHAEAFDKDNVVIAEYRMEPKGPVRTR